MGWDYDYKVNTSRGASSGTALSTVASMIRVLSEGTAGQRDTAVEIPYRMGLVSDADLFAGGFDIPLETDLRYTSAAGTVTHGNGAAGHVHENLLLLRALLMGGTVWFGRNDPHAGRVEVPVQTIIAPTTTTPRRRVFTQLRSLWPFWSEEAQRTALGTSFTLAGTAPVADAKLKIVGGTSVKVTHDQSGDYFQIEGATPSGGIYIDCGEKKATKVTGGASAEAQVEKSSKRWMILDPGSVTFTVSGGGTLTVDLYEQYR